MKKAFLRICIYPIVVLCSLLTVSTALSQEGGMNWLKKIDGTERVQHSYGEMRQTITTSGGSKRTLEFRMWSSEYGDLSLMVYINPPRVKGDKILQRDAGDNIWYYMKRRDVTRHFTGTSRRQNAMGSDFSYEDLSTGDFEEDYTAEFIGYEELDEEKCGKLKLSPTESGPSYEYLILWASADDFIIRRIEYYDKDGLLKTLYMSDLREVEGRTIAFRMKMVNDREGTNTILEYDTVTFSIQPKSAIFTKSALSKEVK